MFRSFAPSVSNSRVRHLANPAFRPTCQFQAKRIVSISRDGENWWLVVENRWEQEIILDSKFNLVSTKRLPAAATK